MDIQNQLVEQFSILNEHMANIISLIDEGNTIPFIARYRKEMTGSVDDQVLRDIHERLLYLRNLEERKAQVISSIEEQGKMTDEIRTALERAATMAEVEDIYRPYKPKRRTRATIAKEKGLEPLALLIWEQETKEKLPKLAAPYVDEEKGVTSIFEALQGASDIIAEIISDDAKIRAEIRKTAIEKGFFTTKAVDTEKESVYEMYYDFTEPVGKVASHRVLAANRGESEEFLSVKIEEPKDEILSAVLGMVDKGNPTTSSFIAESLEDSYKRLIWPSIEREIRSDLTEKAEEGAMKVFSENLRQLLLSAPIKNKIVLALDPGFRTGCKFAIIDGTGKVLETGVIYPVAPHNKETESKNKLIPLINKHSVELVAVGNGTASRETESFVAGMLRDIPKPIHYAIVNEAGASVYSASKLAAQEFPDFDVALRSAVSIGRRMQDPLAELVKIDPKSIGVGQYQHDMNQKKLDTALGGVVEDCVNQVGVDLNTASPSLLSYVSGISGALAQNILEYREENGRFSTRKQLLKVKKLGPKAFEQCAGFLRIAKGESKDLFDSTGVHPESYEAASKLLEKCGFAKEDIGSEKIRSIDKQVTNLKETATELGIGEPTLKDILKELRKPGRDPREDMPEQILRSDVLSMEDLTEGMILSGTVRNVIDFGVFVDIGVHQDGLVHISQISNKFIKHPLEAVSVGDIVQVKVIAIDVAKKRIGLSMKGIKDGV